jgi:hypothetical protein
MQAHEGCLFLKVVPYTVSACRIYMQACYLAPTSQQTFRCLIQISAKSAAQALLSEYCGACRRLFCVGGKDSRSQRLASMEALDAREGKWTSLCDMPEQRSSFGCAAMAGQIYVVGGNDASGTPVASVLCYCPLMQRWRECASLPWRCNSLGLCVA